MKYQGIIHAQRDDGCSIMEDEGTCTDASQEMFGDSSVAEKLSRDDADEQGSIHMQSDDGCSIVEDEGTCTDASQDLGDEDVADLNQCENKSVSGDENIQTDENSDDYIENSSDCYQSKSDSTDYLSDNNVNSDNS